VCVYCMSSIRRWCHSDLTGSSIRVCLFEDVCEIEKEMGAGKGDRERDLRDKEKATSERRSLTSS